SRYPVKWTLLYPVQLNIVSDVHSHQIMITANLNCSNIIYHQNYILFRDHINTKRYQHAVVYIGTKLLLHVLISLDDGGVKKIKTKAKHAWETNAPQMKCFTEAELLKLIKGKRSSWDVTIIYKLIQRVCGLAPIDSGKWTKKVGGEETLETLLYDMKELRNQVNHNTHVGILSSTQLDALLEELKELSMKILDALIETAAKQSKKIEIDRVEYFRNYVEYVIVDVKQPLVE
ncbi:unnamed protein product, partial [Meganyctiphanes norvegica]